MSDLQSLIAAIDRNTAAVTQLAAACAGTVEEKAARKARTPKTTETAPETPAVAAAQPAAANAAPVVAQQATQPAAAASAPASAASAAGGTGPTLQKVADAIIDLANTVSREKAVEVLTKYGAQKVPQIKPADFAAVLVDVGVLKAGGSLAASAGAGLM